MESEVAKQKILLIEDDIFMMEILAQQLTKEGFEVEVAKTGVEGVEKFEKFSPDLVMLDLMLPDKHGFDVFREIRRKPGGLEAKVMVFSNLSGAGEMQEAERLGAIAYLVKANFSLPEVIEKVRSILQK